MGFYKGIINKFTGQRQLVFNGSIVSLEPTVATQNDLPLSGNSKGNGRIVSDTGHLYIWLSDSGSGDLSDWDDTGDIIDLKWSAIENKPSSNVSDIDEAVTKKHTQNTDQYLDYGGPHQVSASEITGSSHTHSNKTELDKVTDGDHDVRTDNPHSVDKSDVGLGNVDDKSEATIITDVKADSDVSDAITKKHTQNTDTVLDNGGSNEVSASEIVKNIYSTAVLAFKSAIYEGLSFFNLVDHRVDEYEDETGIDTVNSVNEYYDSTDDFYRPTGGGTVGVPYAHYKCNDSAANTVVTDDGSGANNGVASTNTENLSVEGKLNNAFEVVGTNSEYANIDALMPNIATDTAGSFAFWGYLDEGGGGWLWAFGDTDTSGHLSFRLYDSTIYFYIRSLGINHYNVRVSGDFTGWHHYFIIQDGTQLKIYVDNIEQELIEDVDTHPGYWFDDCDGLDNGRLGCKNDAGTGNGYFFSGKLDDFRYYRNKALTPSERGTLYNDGAGIEESNPTVSYDNITLISDSISVDAQPDNARVVILEEDINPITLNTDLKSYVSRDNGTTWTQFTLEDFGDYDTSKRVLVGFVDISGQPAGTTLRYKHISQNAKGLKFHATALLND